MERSLPKIHHSVTYSTQRNGCKKNIECFAKIQKQIQMYL